MSKIMAIAAHPGDALFSMGAIVAQHIHAGGSGEFLNLTAGERGHPSIPPDKYGGMQCEAMEKAATALDAETQFLRYRDAEIPRSEEASQAISDVIRGRKPDIIVTHWKGSWHKDHRNTFHLVQDAVFYAALDQPTHAVQRTYFAENWEDATDFQPDVLLDVSAVFDRWMDACALFP